MVTSFPIFVCLSAIVHPPLGKLIIKGKDNELIRFIHKTFSYCSNFSDNIQESGPFKNIHHR